MPGYSFGDRIKEHLTNCIKNRLFVILSFQVKKINSMFDKLLLEGSNGELG